MFSLHCHRIGLRVRVLRFYGRSGAALVELARSSPPRTIIVTCRAAVNVTRPHDLLLHLVRATLRAEFDGDMTRVRLARRVRQFLGSDWDLMARAASGSS
jgi:hypothetical protein